MIIMRSRELAACVACDPTIPVRTQRCFDVHTTSITLKRRCMDVKTTSCAYWDVILTKKKRSVKVIERCIKKTKKFNYLCIL